MLRCKVHDVASTGHEEQRTYDDESAAPILVQPGEVAVRLAGLTYLKDLEGQARCASGGSRRRQKRDPPIGHAGGGAGPPNHEITHGPNTWRRLPQALQPPGNR